ncbi:hypothetical protein ACI2JA_08055 [Alkalihalobacillus sp. NPDC078783]
MIAVNFVIEDENNEFHSTNFNAYSLKDHENCFLDHYDFDNNSPKNFVEYLEFHDVSDYVFICSGQRIKRLVHFLNEYFDIRFHLFDVDLNPEIGSETILNSFSLERNRMIDNPKKMIESNIRKEIHLLITGHYPLSLKSNLLKHIFIEKSKFLLDLDPSILLNSSMNIIIFSNEDFQHIPDIFFCICKSYQLDQNALRELNLVNQSNEEVRANIVQFESTGLINNPQSINGFVDYATVLGIDRLNRLFFYSEGVFADLMRAKELSENRKCDYLNLVNFFSFYKEEPITPSMNIFPTLLNISSQLKNSRKVYAVTPHNTLSNKYFLSHFKNFHLIGLIEDGECSIYNIALNKKYKINKSFILFLEFYLKDDIDSNRLKEIFPSKYDELKDMFYDSISTI